MKIEPFKPEHLASLILQPSQACMQAALSDPAYHAELARHEAYTALDGDRVIACAGVVKLWPGRAQAWALIAIDIGPDLMRSVHFAVKRFLTAHRGRLEMNVAADFENAHRWARALGFKCETPEGMEQYLPEGGSAFLYSRVT